MEGLSITALIHWWEYCTCNVCVIIGNVIISVHYPFLKTPFNDGENIGPPPPFTM